MSTYMLALMFLNAFASGHALARYQDTGEWFYRYAVPVFAVAGIACASSTYWA